MKTKKDIIRKAHNKTVTSKAYQLSIACFTREEANRHVETYAARGYTLIRGVRWSWLKLRYTALLSR